MYELREYLPDDYAACRALWVELTQHHRDIYDAPTIGGDDPGADFDEYLEMENRAISWVATLDGGVVGLTGLLIEGSEAEVEPVIVTASQRGSGIGSALVNRAIGEVRDRGLTSIKVRPVARNASALQFFHGAGFQTLGHVELFMSLGESKREWNSEIAFHDREWRD
ncbi:MAG: GNAT family N-acetyltransferase [bacterium]|nr:GNAT family N-acetyltransferase [bacterium]